MQTFGAFLVSILAASGVLAAPSSSSSRRFGHTAARASVPVVHNRGYHGSGALAYAKAHLKFGASLPADLHAAVVHLRQALRAKRDQGSVTASSVNEDIQYISQVQIGTPEQTLLLDFDSGSSDLWVFSSETEKNDVNGQTVYTPSDSSTAQKMTGASWSIKYGDQSSSSGDVYTDVVTIGGLTVQSQAVESAKKVSDSFTSDSSDSGLLGLAFSAINTVKPKKQKTFFDNAGSSLDTNLFTADLKHNADGKYNFGYIDDSAYTGDIFYTPVDTSDGFWTFTSPGYAIGNDAINDASLTGIADTGTTLLLIASTVVDAYYKQVDGASYSSSDGGYTFDCDSVLPDFAFAVGEGKITVPGKYINFGEGGVSGGKCFGGIQSDEGIGFSIFGDVALKAAYVVFDAENERLGWAAKDL